MDRWIMRSEHRIAALSVLALALAACSSSTTAGPASAPELVFTNTGSQACAMQGFPGVSYVAGDVGQQVGLAAERVGDAGGPVRIAPGATASAQLQLVNVANYDAAVCRPTPVRGLRIYPPDETAALFVPVGATGCAGTPPGSQLTVGTIITP
ncbi:MAG: DUF4232 domain-containing protein [Actinobacteria bacterium]|nr:DUF4232 domain-containing protein [Actinomycetota bacterium]